MKVKLMLIALTLASATCWAAGTDLDRLQTDYKLTDAQMTTLKGSGLPDSQLSMVARLSKESGKSIDDILKMRSEQKMGWGEIAKSLGVPPKELGQSVAEAHRRDMKEEKMERKQERQMAREQRKEERKSERGNHGKGH